MQVAAFRVEKIWKQ